MSDRKVTWKYNRHALIFLLLVIDGELMRIFSMMNISFSLYIVGMKLSLSFISTPYFFNMRTKALSQQLFIQFILCDFFLKQGKKVQRHIDTKSVLWRSIWKCLVSLRTVGVFGLSLSMILVRDGVLVIHSICDPRIEE